MKGSIGKTQFETVTRMNPKGVSELRDISHEGKRSGKEDEFVEHVKLLHDWVKQHLEDINLMYKDKANEKRIPKEFQVGDEVMVYLRKGRFSVGTYNKLKMRKFGYCKILRKFDSGNTKEDELPEDMDISPIFNIAKLNKYHEAESNDDSGSGLENQFPKKKLVEIGDILGCIVGKNRQVQDSSGISRVEVDLIGFPLAPVK